jgi:hypothetical protein
LLKSLAGRVNDVGTQQGLHSSIKLRRCRNQAGVGLLVVRAINCVSDCNAMPIEKARFAARQSRLDD